MIGIASSAHPKIDERTGQMIQCGYQPTAPFLQIYVVEPDGSVSLAEAVDTPWASKFHEIAITENYFVIPLGAVDISSPNPDKNDPLAGLKALRARPDLNMQFGIRKREPGSPIRWFETPSSHYIFHTFNAFERDGKIFMDACTFVNPTIMIENLANMRAGKVDIRSDSHHFLYELDLDKGTCKETQLSDFSAEVPRIDDRWLGYENRFGYASIGKPGEGGFRRIMKYSHTGEPTIFQDLIENQMISEPVFVPRTPDAEEDDGFILAQRYDAANDRTGLDILDARGIDQEPLARLWMDERIPFSVHGSWTSAVK